MFWPDPTHQPIQPPTHPPNHTPTHGWGILHRFQIFKQNWNILISSSVIEFLLILGVHPRGGGRWVNGGGGGYGWGVSHAHTYVHTCTHAHTCMLNMLIMLNMDASMSAAICNFYTCAYVRVHVCACMCVCGGTLPHAPRCPWHSPTHLPPPQSRREPKTAKFNKSWTNRDNSILFKDSLPLNIPELI